MATDITIGGGSSQVTLSQAIELLNLSVTLGTKIAEAVRENQETVSVEEETTKLKELLLRTSDEVIEEARKEAAETTSTETATAETEKA